MRTDRPCSNTRMAAPPRSGERMGGHAPSALSGGASAARAPHSRPRLPEGPRIAAEYILATQQPVKWDASERKWLGAPHPPHGWRVGFTDCLAQALIAHRRAEILDGGILVLTDHAKTGRARSAVVISAG